MSRSDPPPLPLDVLDAKVRELLRAEKGAVFAPEDARARVLTRLGHALPPPGSGGGGGARGASPVAETAAVVARLARPVSLGLAFLLGGGAGIGLWHATQSPRTVYVDRIVYAPVPSAPVVADTTPDEVAAVTPDERVRAPVPSNASSSAPSPGQLSAERMLLDVARAALGRGDGPESLTAVAKHERRFPAGALAEEREAIAIRALILTQRFDDARARGARFHRRFPGSVLIPAVDAALATTP